VRAMLGYEPGGYDRRARPTTVPAMTIRATY